MSTDDRETHGAGPRSVFPGFRDLGTGPGGLARSLSKIRRERGLTQTEVAALMGTSQSAVARLEAGGADVRLSTIERYAAALDVRLGFGVRTDDDQRARP